MITASYPLSSLVGATPFTATSVDYWAIAPVLALFAGALAGVLVEAFVSRRARPMIQLAVAVVSILAALALLVLAAVKHRGITLAGAYVNDGVSLFITGSLLLLGLVGVLMMAERFDGEGPDAFTPSGAASPGSPSEAAATRMGFVTSEIFPLTLFSLAGMVIMAAAGDLLTMFVALEVLSLPLYILTGLARRRRLLSQEASLKYFLLGAFSSAFFLFGAGLLYGYSGSVSLRAISQAIVTRPGTMDMLLLPGILFVLIGVLFKVGAVPFHSWVPDVYQGAPTPVTGFMAACTKVAAFGALLRLAYVAFQADRWDWRGGVIAVAALTMVVGALLTVSQTDVKRLLAYSSVSHAGFVLVGVLAFHRSGVAGVLFYLVAYGFTTIAAFGVVQMVRSGGSEATRLSQWAGLGRRHPMVAAVFAFLLMSMAGLPLTSGFVAKVAAFAPAIAHGGRSGVALAVLGVLASAVTAYAYFRVLVLMFFDDAEGDEVVALTPSMMLAFAVAVGTLVTLVLGVFPGPVLALAESASRFLQ